MNNKNVLKNFRVLIVPRYINEDELKKNGIIANATVEAEYGETVIEGREVTLAHHTEKNKNNHAPCNTPNVPVLNDDCTIIISHLDLDTIRRYCCFNW